METSESSDAPLCRVLEPPNNWDTGNHDERVRDFVGTSSAVSTYDEAVCPGLVVLAAYYGNRRGHGPANNASPKRLRFRLQEVLTVGGRLQQTSAANPWPPEYDRAHRDIVARQEAVAEHVVTLCERDETRVVVTSRSQLLVAIFALASRPEADGGFLDKVRVRARKLLRDELNENYLQLAEKFPALCYRFLEEDGEQQKQVRRYRQRDRRSWDAVARAIPKIREDGRFM